MISVFNLVVYSLFAIFILAVFTYFQRVIQSDTTAINISLLIDIASNLLKRILESTAIYPFIHLGRYDWISCNLTLSGL